MPKVFKDYIKVSVFLLWELLLIEPYISEDMIPVNNLFLPTKKPPPSGKNSCSLNSLLLFLVLPHIL